MKYRLAATAVLASVLLCGFTCTKSTQSLSTASDAISHALLDAQTAVNQGVASGVISPAESANIEKYLAAVGSTGLQLDTAIKQNQSATSVSAQAVNFMSAFNALQQQGVLGIHDPKTQLTISTIITGAETSIAVIQAQVGGK